MMPLSFGLHRMSSPCASGATASDVVTFMRAASSLIPSTYFIACLLFAWTNFHVSFAIAAPTHANEKYIFGAEKLQENYTYNFAATVCLCLYKEFT